MSTRPDISVIMSTYNDAGIVLPTVESVLGQTEKSLELVLINDGSTDPAVAGELEAIAHLDERIRLVSDTNRGLTRALNKGCALARGTFLARIDAGDTMTSERLERQKELLMNNRGLALITSWCQFCGPNWEPLYLSKGKKGKTDVTHHGSVMFRHDDYDAAGGYRAEFYYGQDWDLWYRLMEKGEVFMIEQPYYRARIFPDSISMTRKHWQDQFAECSRQATHARKEGEPEQPWLARAQAISDQVRSNAGVQATSNSEPGFYFIAEALRRVGDARCRGYFWHAIRNKPYSARSYLRWLQSWKIK